MAPKLLHLRRGLSARILQSSAQTLAKIVSFVMHHVIHNKVCFARDVLLFVLLRLVRMVSQCHTTRVGEGYKIAGGKEKSVTTKPRSYHVINVRRTQTLPQPPSVGGRLRSHRREGQLGSMPRGVEKRGQRLCEHKRVQSAARVTSSNKTVQYQKRHTHRKVKRIISFSVVYIARRHM